MKFTFLAAARRLDGLNGFGHSLQHHPRFGQKDAAGGRQPDSLGVVLEQGQLKFIFEVKNLPAQAGL